MIRLLHHLINPSSQAELLGPKENTDLLYWGQSILLKLAHVLLRRSLPWSEERLVRLFEGLELRPDRWRSTALSGVVRVLESWVESHGLPAAMAADPVRWRAMIPASLVHRDAAERKVITRFQAVLARASAGPPKASDAGLQYLHGEDLWALRLRAFLQQVEVSAAPAWEALFAHAAKAQGARPTVAWSKAAPERIAAVGPSALATLLSEVLPEVGKPRPLRKDDGGMASRAFLVDERDADLLRGLLWYAGSCSEPSLDPVLAKAVEVGYRPLPNDTQSNSKIANACLYALAAQGRLEAVAELSRLRTRVRSANGRKEIEKALVRSAERLGLTTDELEELATPTCGLETVGALDRELVGYTAELRVEAGGAELTWRTPSGKRQASVPKAVREGAAAELAALKKAVQEIDRMLPSLQARLEAALVERRKWTVATWCERCVDHPLMGTVARRLIWTIGSGASTPQVAWHEGAWLTVTGEPVASLDPEAPVELWHPLDGSPEEVRAWRVWFEERQLRQPFKQAHREVYLLTDAERTTEVYSNRFAAHILRQHQFAALARERGWRYTLQGGWDSWNVPYRELPALGVRVEFHVEGAGDGADDLAESGIYLYLSTDQVRFFDAQGQPLRLETIPVRTFSELMRDVDLFVGVASIGADPGWVDQGRPQFDGYWRDFAFGELSAQAAVRRDLLARLVPRLKVADRCSLAERFLVVRGNLRTYKIHLGSGNILMSPNDQYLCIVRGRGERTAGPLLLPFEGDAQLAIILSKALLLAADDQIDDPTITRQIRP